MIKLKQNLEIFEKQLQLQNDVKLTAEKIAKSLAKLYLIDLNDEAKESMNYFLEQSLEATCKSVAFIQKNRVILGICSILFDRILSQSNKVI